jgi:hypothetical protein
MFLLTLLACGAADETGAGSFAFDGGNFQFTTLDVDDQCYDNGLRTIFMPSYPDPEPFSDPVEIPSWSDLPQTYEISLQEPFGAMEVTVTAGARDGIYQVRGAEQTDVLLDEDQFDDCLIDSDIDIDLVTSGDNALGGNAVLATGNFRGEHCPEVDADPCDIILTLDASRS